MLAKCQKEFEANRVVVPKQSGSLFLQFSFFVYYYYFFFKKTNSEFFSIFFFVEAPVESPMDKAIREVLLIFVFRFSFFGYIFYKQIIRHRSWANANECSAICVLSASYSRNVKKNGDFCFWLIRHFVGMLSVTVTIFLFFFLIYIYFLKKQTNKHLI